MGIFSRFERELAKTKARTEAARQAPPEDFAPAYLDYFSETGAPRRKVERARRVAWSRIGPMQAMDFREDVPGFRSFLALHSLTKTLIVGEDEQGLLHSAVASRPQSESIDDETLATALLNRDTRHNGPMSLGGRAQLAAVDWTSLNYRTHGLRFAQDLSEEIAAAAGIDEGASLPPVYSACLKLTDQLGETVQQRLIARGGDPQIVQMVDNGVLPATLSAVNWANLPGYEKSAANGLRTIKPARDTLSQMPLLGGALAANHQRHNENGSRAKEMTEALYDGEKPVELMVREFGISRPLANHLRRAKIAYFANDLTSVGKALEALDEISDPRRIDVSQEGLNNAILAVRANRIYAMESGNSHGLDGCKGNFGQIVKSLGDQPASGMTDFANSLRDTLVLPALWQQGAAAGLPPDEAATEAVRRSAAHPALQGMTLTQAMKASTDWHRRLTGINDRILDESSTRSWQPVLGTLELEDGITAHELTSNRALKTEGRTQDHCVGGYGPSVVDGECLIFSLRRGEQILSTVELAGVDGNVLNGVEIRQNFGRGNADATSEADAAAKSLQEKVDAIPAGQWHDYDRELRKVRTAVNGSSYIEHLRDDRVGYDFTDPAKVERAYQELKTFLPKSQRARTAKEWGAMVFQENPAQEASRGASQDAQMTR